MARPKKENAGESSLDIAGTEQAETSASALPDVIESEEDAKALVKAKYKVPIGVSVAFVTSDKQVFWQQNENSAHNHAVKNDLKLFRIACQDFQE